MVGKNKGSGAKVAETEGKKRVRKRFTKETLRLLHPPLAPWSLPFSPGPPSLRPEGFSLHNKTALSQGHLDPFRAGSLKTVFFFF